MLDIKFIRENPEKVKESCKKRQVKVDIDRLLKIDKERRENLQKLEEIRAQKNNATQKISRLKDIKEKKKIIAEMQELDKRGDELKESLRPLEDELGKLMHQVPNILLEGVPAGRDENDNVVIREEGKKTDFDFAPKDYLDISLALDLIDIKRAAKVSGSRFGYLKGDLVLMEFALVSLAFEVSLAPGTYSGEAYFRNDLLGQFNCKVR